MVWSGDDQFKEIRCDSGTAFLLYEMLYADDILSQLTNALYRTETHLYYETLFFVAKNNSQKEEQSEEKRTFKEIVGHLHGSDDDSNSGTGEYLCCRYRIL